MYVFFHFFLKEGCAVGGEGGGEGEGGGGEDGEGGGDGRGGEGGEGGEGGYDAAHQAVGGKGNGAVQGRLYVQRACVCMQSLCVIICVCKDIYVYIYTVQGRL